MPRVISQGSDISIRRDGHRLVPVAVTSASARRDRLRAGPGAITGHAGSRRQRTEWSRPLSSGAAGRRGRRSAPTSPPTPVPPADNMIMRRHLAAHNAWPAARLAWVKLNWRRTLSEAHRNGEAGCERCDILVWRGAAMQSHVLFVRIIILLVRRKIILQIRIDDPLLCRYLHVCSDKHHE